MSHNCRKSPACNRDVLIKQGQDPFKDMVDRKLNTSASASTASQTSAPEFDDLDDDFAESE